MPMSHDGGSSIGTPDAQVHSQESPTEDHLRSEAAGPSPAPASPSDTLSGSGGTDIGSELDDAGTSSVVWQLALPSWLVSLVVHAAVLIVLAFLTVPQPKKDLIVATGEVVEAEEEPIEDVLEDVMEPAELQVLEDAPMELESTDVPVEEIVVPEFQDVDAAPMEVEFSDFANELAPKNDLSASIGTVTGQGLEGRGAEMRARMVREAGGSKGSEAAVALALKWLAAHQLRDGGWNFDHRTAACRNQCDHPGRDNQARIGATAMALLPFLGAGQTHKEGKYRKTVQAGLAFLIRQAKPRGKMADLTDRQGRMYSHGLASITLCEAYAMTRDPQLLGPAQYALNFIAYAQDPIGGGWRYQPKQPGDTSVVGWQLMALKSGHMGYLVVPKVTIAKANRFLDAVQADGGARYGYTQPGRGQATTAVGLLCRMYLGWKHDHKALKQGVTYLSKTGPNNNLYYDYYATQVMRHYGGPEWKKWNGQMRDWLVKQQDKKGHAKGSWYINGPHSDAGGRLYCTSLATLILEVYYRHLPIYNKAATEDDFPL